MTHGVNVAALRRAMRRLAEPARAAVRAVTAAAEAAVAEARRLHPLVWALVSGPEGRNHRRRCPICRPRGYSPPPPINGRAYARRRRARARRRARRAR